ncbi:MAG: hypothetical protein ACM3PP_05915 [Candidatus Saccharibacteria bacterium]
MADVFIRGSGRSLRGNRITLLATGTCEVCKPTGRLRFTQASSFGLITAVVTGHKVDLVSARKKPVKHSTLIFDDVTLRRSSGTVICGCKALLRNTTISHGRHFGSILVVTKGDRIVFTSIALLHGIFRVNRTVSCSR